MSISTEEVLKTVELAITHFRKTALTEEEVLKTVNEVLGDHINDIILNMVGMKKSRWDSGYEVVHPSIVDAIIKDKITEGVDKFLNEVASSINLAPTKQQLAAIKRNAKSKYLNALREVVTESVVKRANDDAAKLTQLIVGSPTRVADFIRHYRSNHIEATEEINTEFKSGAVLEAAVAESLVHVDSIGKISPISVEDPSNTDVRVLVRVTDKLLHQSAHIVVDGEKWQPAVLWHEDGEYYLTSEFNWGDHAVFSLMGPADKVIINEAVQKFVDATP